MQRTRLVLLATWGLAGVAGCSRPDAVNEANFAAAINRQLAQRSQTCITFEEWPTDVEVNQPKYRIDTPGSIASQMDFLEQSGLVTHVDATIEREGGLFSSPGKVQVAVRRYSFTDAATPFVREGSGLARAPSKGARLCWGKMEVQQVVKWMGPVKLGDYQEVGVEFTYKLVDVAPWTQKPGFTKVYPWAQKVFDDAEKGDRIATLRLTNKGWE